MKDFDSYIVLYHLEKLDTLRIFTDQSYFINNSKAMLKFRFKTLRQWSLIKAFNYQKQDGDSLLRFWNGKEKGLSKERESLSKG